MLPVREFVPLARLTSIGLAALTAGTVMVYGPLPSQPRFVPSEHPAAVLAWAKLRCNPQITLERGVPRAQTEDLIEVAAAYDHETRYRPLLDVCAEALEHASHAGAVILHAPDGGPATDTAALLASRN